MLNALNLVFLEQIFLQNFSLIQLHMSILMNSMIGIDEEALESRRYQPLHAKKPNSLHKKLLIKHECLKMVMGMQSCSWRCSQRLQHVGIRRKLLLWE
ncbi:hypothetical protein MA16_Dca007333 [Dendrobium catenatum]|uniref:Uncharacterized protein n=1 Tax=Dendrobium catenatum TaxID=906689 RepID=A0A2I0W8H6_9ASPA|nr:hypothetical protein MA16_Dca007333 [Dendrobium catenatum]